jgi:hypothetical protein
MKKCSMCKIEKPLVEFEKDNRRKDGLQTSCKNCKRSASNKYYLANKDLVRKKAAAHRAETCEIINKIKESSSCKDCGVNYPYYVMHFDHIADDKEFNVSWGIMNRSREAVLEEIKKCELVCANCHAVRTYKRIQQGLVQ